MNQRSIRTLPAILLLLLFSAASADAQKMNTDSLQQIIHESRYDTAKADALLQLANYQLKHLRQDSAGLETLRAAKTLSDKINYRHGLLQVLLTTGNYHRSNNDWAGSLSAYQEILNLTANSTDSTSLKARMMASNNLGGVFNTNSDYNSSLDYRLTALKIAEQLMPDNYMIQGTIVINICSDYRRLQIPSKALAYLKQARRIFPRLPERLKMEYYYEVYENYKGTDSAWLAYAMLDSIATGLENFDLSPFQLNDFTQMYYHLKGLYLQDVKKDPAAALAVFDQALQLALQLNNSPGYTEALLNKGLVYAGQQNYRQAIGLLQEAHDSSVVNTLKNLTLRTATALAAAWQNSGNAAKAIPYYKAALKLQGEIYNEEQTARLSFLEARYQAEKKEKEIAALQLKDAENLLIITRRNRLLLLSGIAGAAFILILFLLYRNTRQQKLLAEKEQKIQQDQIRFLERQQQVVSLQSMINGQETERTRIARDLHDGLSGMFSTVKMYCSSLMHEKTDLQEHGIFKKTVEMIDQAADEIRRIAHNMMPEVLMKLGLVHAANDLCGNISAGKLLTVKFQHYGMEQRLNADTEVMLYRILQELLNNIIKHARATEAIVQFNRDGDRLMVTVEDNGKGFDLLQGDGKTHAGLDTVKSRVDYLNGQLNIDSKQEIGTTVTMEFLIHEVV